MKTTRKGLSTLKPLSRYSAIFVLLTIMCGCSTKTLIRPAEPFQENQLTLCPVTLPRLSGPTGTDFRQSLEAYIKIYTACAARHNSLVGIIRKRKEL